jgi:signal peptidase I
MVVGEAPPPVEPCAVGVATAVSLPVRAASGTPRLWWRIARDLLRGMVVLIALHVFVLQISVVRGHSMQPSLSDGDRLVVDRLSPRLSGVSRFDVVVLRYPRDPSVDFVKRVVGLPGDHVRIERSGLYVNGRLIDQLFLHIDDPVDMPECVVPEGHYLVLGDNRPISCDSREFGMVPAELVKGLVRARFWPLDRVALFD